MSHGALGSAMIASLERADMFSKSEYPKVSLTRIRCVCAIFGCMQEGIDSVFFAKHVMKSKDETTKMHYNLYANHCEDLKLAMMVGDTLEVGGVKKKRMEKKILTNLPLQYIVQRRMFNPKDKIIKFLENVEMDSNEMILIQ